MTPKMFGGDVAKAMESFQKSLAIDPSQDEAWLWLSKAYQKQGDKTKARDAVHHALTLNRDSAWIRSAAESLDNR
jgi:Tfp pilus assembly protein PilF